MRSRAGTTIPLALFLVGVGVGLSGCDGLPGKPDSAARPLAPSEVTDFAVLYGTHCAGCHGPDGRMGAARPMNDPVYLAVVDDSVLVGVIADGVPGTMMPGFGPTGRGTLADEQIEGLVAGMREHWARPEELRGVSLPSYNADGAAGDAGRGERVYVRRCAECHGDATLRARRERDHHDHAAAAGSVVDPSYLALVSDQALRSAVIAGRPDFGMPDWRGRHETDGAAPLTDRDIDDVVAWMVSKRTHLAGSPYGGAAR